MEIGLVIYGSLKQRSGGYLYDRKLVEGLNSLGDRVNIISLPSRTYTGNLLSNFSRELMRRLTARPFDVLLEDQLTHPSLLLPNRRLRRAGSSYPIVTLVHHLRSSEPHSRALRSAYRSVERAYLRTVDGAIYNSRVTRSEVDRALGMKLPGVVAHPGRDHLNRQVDPQAIRDRASRHLPLRLVFLGNLIPRKGLHILLESLAALPSDRWRLTVIGSLEFDRSYSASIRREVERMNGKVRLLGPLPHDRLQEHLMRSHAMVIPSSYEGFGIAYLEGMGFGLPAIATIAGGASDFVRDGENGYLIPPNDPSALVDRLASLDADRALLAQMGEQALADFNSHPTWEESVTKIRRFLVEQTERKPRF